MLCCVFLLRAWSNSARMADGDLIKLNEKSISQSQCPFIKIILRIAEFIPFIHEDE